MVSTVMCREAQPAGKGKKPQDCDLRRGGAAAGKPRAPFRPGGNAAVRSARPSALVRHPIPCAIQPAFKGEHRMADTIFAPLHAQVNWAPIYSCALGPDAKEVRPTSNVLCLLPVGRPEQELHHRSQADAGGAAERVQNGRGEGQGCRVGCCAHSEQAVGHTTVM